MTKTEKALLAREIEVNRKVRAAYREFNRLARKELDKLGGLKAVQESSAKFKQFKRSIPRLMKRAGIDKVLFNVSDILPKIESISLAEMSGDIGRIVGKIRDSVGLRKKLLNGTNKANNQILRDQLATTNKKLTEKAFKSLNSKNDFNKMVKSIGAKSKAELQTVVSTSVQGYDNMVVTEKANELGLDRFKYAGVDDSLNRPFCAERVGKIYTDKQAEKWDNGTSLPAKDFLGSWNCRHRKRYIVEDN